MSQVVAEQSKGPEEYIKEYDKFIYLIDGRAEQEINTYITENHTFEDFSNKVKFFDELGKTLNDSLPKGENFYIEIIQSFKKK